MTSRQSFEDWHLPRELDGVLLLEDRRDGTGWLPAQERHSHEELELHFVARGRGTFSLPGGRVTAEPGTLVWVPPTRDHVLEDASADLVRWMLLCRRRVVQRVLPQGGTTLVDRSARELVGRLTRPLLTSLHQTFTDVRQDRARELPVVNAGIGFALARAWQSFQSGAGSPEPSAVHPAVLSVIRALREPGDRPPMHRLAERAGVTESHLSKLFAREVGITITEFRNRVGVERFLDLYGDGTGPTLLGAALDAGFGSYPQFYRIFTKHMGYPPAEHRARARIGREAGRS